MADNITVSIIICTRDRARDLQETLQSLFQVTVPKDWRAELIVIDNGSTDNTGEVVRKCDHRDLPVRYVLERRAGKSNAYNAGIAAASGRILLFTDDDIRFPLNWIEAMCSPILKGEVDALAGGVKLGEHLERPWMDNVQRLVLGAATEDLSDDNFEMIGANMAFSAAVLTKVPAFDPELGPGALGLGEDTLFSWQLLRAGYRVKLLKEVIVEHHFNVSRLAPQAFIMRARSMGRSIAYLTYHWQQRRVRLPFLRYIKAWLRLRLYRLRKKENASDSDAANWCLFLRAVYARAAPSKKLRSVRVGETTVPIGEVITRSKTLQGPRVAIVCSGMDKVKRGYEIYARDLFGLLQDVPDFSVTLIKGSGKREPDEKVIFNLQRDSLANRVLCRFVGWQWKYYIEFATFACGLVPLLLFGGFNVFYVLEGPLYKFLNRWRRRFGLQYKLIHFTGGQLGRLPATPLDYLHHVTPTYQGKAIELGFCPANQFLIPHFLSEQFGGGNSLNAEIRRTVRRELGIADNATIVLSVGTIDSQVKRMDYVINEVAALEERAFLLLVGQPDSETKKIDQLAKEKLGTGRFKITTVARDRLVRLYQAADVFVLASLNEGFGLVLIEALANGLPVIVHDYETSHYVLGEYGRFADLTKTGELSKTITHVLKEEQTEQMKLSRRSYATYRYGINTLRRAYIEMMHSVCDASPTAYSRSEL
jgi:glycosyltransferase involved in cell wall biosynthesis